VNITKLDSCIVPGDWDIELRIDGKKLSSCYFREEDGEEAIQFDGLWEEVEDRAWSRRLVFSSCVIHQRMG